jgi:hypothetical protein
MTSRKDYGAQRQIPEQELMPVDLPGHEPDV